MNYRGFFFIFSVRNDFWYNVLRAYRKEACGVKKADKTTVTIRTIAQLANVSHMTVSRALNDSELVKPATKEKILAIAKEIGYVPNINAKSLVTNRSYMIGIFFTNLETGTSNSFMTDVVAQAQAVLPKSYSLSINSVAKAMAGQYISINNYDGIIVISQSKSDYDFIEYVHNLGLPLVVLNRVIERNDINNYAIQMGHRKLALIRGVDSFESSVQRTNGFMQAVEANGIAVDPTLIKVGDYRPESGHELMREILASGNIPSCVICENDDMAVGAISACVELGYQIPRDISFIGFDDMAYAKFITPSLTTIKKPTAQIIEMGVAKLMAIVEGEQSDVEQKIVDPEMVIRQSVVNLYQH